VKLLLDQQLSRRLIPLLAGAFPGTTHVVLVGLSNSSDDAIWEFAKSEGFTIVTKDEDFQVLSFSRGHPPKVIWIRSGNGPTAQVMEVITSARSIIDEFDADTERSLLVLP
jgi:predicted nuclease of predicted toxin-antitoxin system